MIFRRFFRAADAANKNEIMILFSFGCNYQEIYLERNDLWNDLLDLIQLTAFLNPHFWNGNEHH